MRFLLTIGALALMMVACSGTASPPARCERAPQAILDKISEGLTIAGGGSLSNGWAVRSKDYEKVWFVAAELTGEGIPASTMAIWATNSLNGDGMIFSAGAMAKEFSQWGPGSFSSTDDGAQEAIRCAE